MATWFRTRTFLVGAALVSGLACVTLGASGSRAASLAGDTINGTLNFCALGNGGNVFSPASGTAPLSFQYVDGSNTDTATFSATTLTVEDQVSDRACGWGMSFTDTSTPFSSLTLISSNFSPDLTFDFTGGVIDISWAGIAAGPADFIAVFAINGVLPTPEPGSLAVFGVALAGVGLIRQWRRPAGHEEDGPAGI
jgi:hypothetical protein